MTRTLINGKYVMDPIKDLSIDIKLIQRQHTAMIDSLNAIRQCKNISQVRKCLVHTRQSYPIKEDNQ